MVEKVEKIEKDVAEKLEKIENGVLEEAKMKKKVHKKCKCIELQIKSLDSRIEGIETDLKAVRKYLHRLSKANFADLTKYFGPGGLKGGLSDKDGSKEGINLPGRCPH
ncbi:unnamed protein product [Citrullus colocynthis]|uniref:Uncharacterized protein n=1 Tax=Citrullus colocynthis TaxID=252529 RepID=A0ABP0Z846_9ROSI